MLATIVAQPDPASAAAMAEAVSTPERKISALSEIVAAIPASERVRERESLERIAFPLRNDLKRADAGMPLDDLTTLAQQWLDLGDRDRARAVLDAGKARLGSIPARNAGMQGAFLAQLARTNPAEAIERSRTSPAPG